MYLPTDFEELTRDFLVRCEVHHDSERTTELYKHRIQRFVDWCETRGITPTSLTAKNVEDYLYKLTRLRDGKPVSANTMRGHAQILRTYLLYAERHEMILASIDFEMPPMPKAKIAYLSEESQQALLNHPKLSVRDRALCAFIIDTGARMVEWRALNWNALSFDPAEDMGAAWLQIVKRPGNPRETYFFKETWGYLENYRKAYKLGSDDPLFIKLRGSYERQSITSIGGGAIFRRISKQVGFRVRAHLLRHTSGRNWAKRGLSPQALQRIMGHANLKTTERYSALTQSDTRSLCLATVNGNGR